VSAFVEAFGGRDAISGVRGASIGPVTTSAARAIGIDVIVEASESTIPGLVGAIVDHFGGESA
jgi:uroporphyrinogen III methyltransferase/synthase